MQVKRFFAADMRQAMKLVREELGADAAIIGNRRVAGGIELTAALDYPLEPTAPVRANPELEAELRLTQSRIVKAHSQLSAPRESFSRERQIIGERPADPRIEPMLSAAPRPAPARAPASAPAPAPSAPAFVARTPTPAPAPAPVAPAPAPVVAAPAADTKALDAMRAELLGLRELIEVQLGSIAWGQVQNRQPRQAGLWRRLQRMGMPADLSRTLLEKVAKVEDPRQAWRMVLAYLAQAIRVVGEDPLEAGGVIALVGPAGAGKTTTLAKMAAQYVLKHGAQNIALVTMDSFRIGAQEQLRTLGRILDVPVTTVDPGHSLLQALTPLARKHVILIDTAGLPASDPTLRIQLDALASRGLSSKNYLVMPATSQSQVLKAAWHSYKQCGLAGCILTKLDEAATLGEVIGVAISQQLPLAYLADGPRIPDDLHLPRGHQLVSRAVGLQVADEPTEDDMANLFTGLYSNRAERDTARQVG